MTNKKLLLSILVFVLYVAVVWPVCLLLLSDSKYLIAFIMTFCGLTVLVVYILVSRLAAAHHAAPPSAASGPVPAPVVSGQGGDDEAVSAIIREANDRLAKSPTLASQRAKSTVADFPLYLMIGSEGSGKTSLFLASKMEPELLAGQVHRDSAVVSTRLGNIWFAGGAVVVEASGSFFSGEPVRWNRFVTSFHQSRTQSRMAKVFAPQAPSKLNGVIVCCDLTQFVGGPDSGVPDSARISAMSQVIQQRLRAVGEIFQCDFPVHVIFTKSDKLKYFTDYFRRLTDSEDQQILGCSLPSEPQLASEVFAESETKRISAALNLLYLSLTEKRLLFLAREKDPANKPSIYEFPRELKRIRGPLVQFLVDVFRPNPLQPNPRLQGLYFTGTRKVVAPMGGGSRDLLDGGTVHFKVGDVTRMLKAEDVAKFRAASQAGGGPEPEITRWTFAADLWRQLLNSGRTAVGPVYVNRRDEGYRKAAFAGVAAVSAIAITLFAVSSIRNHALLSSVQDAAANCVPLEPGAKASLPNLQAIEELRNRIATLADYDTTHPPLFMRFGLYSGSALLAPAQNLYYARFRDYFLSPVVNRLAAGLSSLPRQSNGAVSYLTAYTDLKTYRTVTAADEARCEPDATLAKRLLAVWRENRVPDPEAEKIAEANFQFYVTHLAPDRIPVEYKIKSDDDRVVVPARRYLNKFPLADQQYQSIIEHVNQDARANARLIDVTRDDATYRSVLHVEEEVQAAFTSAGWDKVQKLIAQASGGNPTDSCVLKANSGAAGSQVDANTALQLQDRYIRDYILRWKEFLTKASLLPYKGCADAADKLKALKAVNSPILAVLAMTSENTFFKSSAPPSKQDTPVKINDGSAAPLTQDSITREFQAASAVFQNPPPSRTRWTDDRNDPYVGALGDLQRAFVALGSCSNSTDPAAMAAVTDAKTAVKNADKVLDDLSHNFDTGDVFKSVMSLLASPIRAAERALPAPPDPRQKIEQERGDFCGALSKLKGKYPFDPKTREDAALEDVAAVFSPKVGRIASLHAAIDSARKNTDAPVKLTGSFVDFNNRISAVSKALFSSEGAAGMQCKLSLIANPSVKQIVDSGDQRPFPVAENEYVWPPSRPGLDLRVEETAGGSTPFRKYAGIWSVFRLLSDADEHRPGTSQYTYRYVQAGERQTILTNASDIIIEVKESPNGVPQAFEKGFFTQALACPSKAAE